MTEPTRVLFVCLGNICRSPTAEGVFRQLVKAEGCERDFVIDSAGTGAWHAGEPPDRRMTAAAKRRGYTLEGRARQVRDEDFLRFDHLLAMDESNLGDLLAMAPPAARSKVRLLRDFDEPGATKGVPDPYYGGSEGFDEVVTIVERCAERLLEALLAEREA